MKELRGRRVAFGYGNLLCNNNYKSSLCKSSPPLSAIDRFLWGQTQSLSSHSQAAHERPYSIQNNVKINKGTVLGSTSDALLRGFSFPNDAIGVYLPRQTNPEESFLDELFVDGEILALADDKNPNMEMKASMKGDFPKRVVKRSKKVASAALIKGQWTDDEDRKLIRLVKQYGVRKWAQIAESLVGRAGKQCRERWHNHLRPDIKVSLCFHVLYFTIYNQTEFFITLLGFVYFLPEPSESDDSHPLVAQTYDDELMFMQNFFANNNNTIHPSLDYSQTRNPTEVFKSVHVVDHNLSKGSSTIDCTTFTDTRFGFSSSIQEPNNEPRTTYLFSDLYLSRLLNGATTSSFPNGDDYYNGDVNTNLLSEQASSDGRKEMDLIEMVSSCQFYP
ncbi:hypothetical protein GOBAR_AA26871 [Gossypium barbadense]|uniref:Uncharacterized protein n=1 Tax=Gossypium barbadense TaxID=3634 RepID=A0A2P5WRS1_GOSBA|nr:hypothetical protein GOBAR_AA26871 [Gossypium barbadense]